MATQSDLIAALRRKFPEPDAAIARRVGLSQQRFNNYAAGRRSMDDDAVIGCAQALGIDAKEALAAHRAETAHTTRERAFWRRLGAAASVAAVALFALPLATVKAHGGQGEPSAAICIMRTVLLWLRTAFSPARGSWRYGKAAVLA